LARIDNIITSETKPMGELKFLIRETKSNALKKALISPDVCVCDDCLQELFDQNNRRYRYPFINCTNCGPRFTITAGIPYDRVNTTMSKFPMCEDCAGEYHDPSDRRFHAQPVACGKCGPSLFLLDSDGNRISQGSEIEKATELLKKGKIVAIKGLGGYHLACDAKNDNAVKELRKRKKRDGKPFALMAKNIETVLKYCFVNNKESEILQSVKNLSFCLKENQKQGLPLIIFLRTTIK
jgi:hydrogenase maturation protein HypF